MWNPMGSAATVARICRRGGGGRAILIWSSFVLLAGYCWDLAARQTNLFNVFRILQQTLVGHVCRELIHINNHTPCTRIGAFSYS